MSQSQIPDFPNGIGQAEDEPLPRPGLYELSIPQPGVKVPVVVSAEVRSVKRGRFVPGTPLDPGGFWIFETYLSTGLTWLRITDTGWEVYDVSGGTGAPTERAYPAPRPERLSERHMEPG